MSCTTDSGDEEQHLLSKTKLLIPYTENGSIPTYPNNHITYMWREPEPFAATLTLASHERGRSAAHFIMRADTGAIFVAFITDLFDMVRDVRWMGGKITATFEPCKRGTNYGVRLMSCKGKPLGADGKKRLCLRPSFVEVAGKHYCATCAKEMKP